MPQEGHPQAAHWEQPNCGSGPIRPIPFHSGRKLVFSMRILFTGVNPGIDSSLEHKASIASVAKRHGHIVCQALWEAPEVVICVDYQKSFRPLLTEAKKLGIPCVLVKQEPVVVFPQHGKANPGGLFNEVVTRGDPSSQPIFNTFQEWDASRIDFPKRMGRVVAISANKWSMIPGEYYSLRRRVFAKDSRVDLFGPGWNEVFSTQLLRVIKEIVISLRFRFMPTIGNIRWAFLKPASYLGVAKSKVETLSSYKVSLVIENNGSYMSEKLVDCILAGTIPVYVGESISGFQVPQDLVVVSRPEVGSIIESIDEALSWDSYEFRLRAKEWASREGIKERWESEYVIVRLLDHVQDKITSYRRP